MFAPCHPAPLALSSPIAGVRWSDLIGPEIGPDPAAAGEGSFSFRRWRGARFPAPRPFSVGAKDLYHFAGSAGLAFQPRGPSSGEGVGPKAEVGAIVLAGITFTSSRKTADKRYGGVSGDLRGGRQPALAIHVPSPRGRGVWAALVVAGGGSHTPAGRAWPGRTSCSPPVILRPSRCHLRSQESDGPI